MNGIIGHVEEVGSLLTAAAIIIATGSFLLNKEMQRISSGWRLTAGLYVAAVGFSLVFGPIVLLSALLYALTNLGYLFLASLVCIFPAVVPMFVFFISVTIHILPVLLPSTRFSLDNRVKRRYFLEREMKSAIRLRQMPIQRQLCNMIRQIKPNETAS